MTCCEYENRLSAYLDGELPRWSRWKVQNHLRGCEHCSSAVQELAELDSGLLALSEADPAPEYLAAAVIHRLPAMPPARPVRRGFMPWAAGLAVAGMQALALFGAYWWGFMRGTTNTDPGYSTAGIVSPGGVGRKPAANAGQPVPQTRSVGLGSTRSGPIWSAQPTRFGPIDPAQIEQLEGNAPRRTSPVAPKVPGLNVVLPAPAR